MLTCIYAGELESRLVGLTESERTARETLVTGNTRCSALEIRLSAVQRDLETVQEQLRDTVETLRLKNIEKDRSV